LWDCRRTKAEFGKGGAAKTPKRKHKGAKKKAPGTAGRAKGNTAGKSKRGNKKAGPSPSIMKKEDGKTHYNRRTRVGNYID
jgi:hypothetical protein